jgi:uncharacterized repeat protein (TIGR01451 family)
LASLAPAAPVLKWQHGGCYSSWCETGWYSSPVIADLDGDGAPEALGATYSLFVLDGASGDLRWSVDPPGGRVWPGVILADLQGDGSLEIATAHGGGYLHVRDAAGALLWSRQPATSELRGLSAYDLQGDGSLELIATAAVGSAVNTWIFASDGSLRPGWPQLSDDSGYAWGVFNDNAAVGDTDGDGAAEIIVPSDVHYINAYEANGAQIQAHAMYGDKGWGKVGVHVDHAVDLRGYAHCGTEHRPNFAHTPAAIADVDGDGANEIVAMGNVYNCGTSPYTSLYEMPFLFNADRSRWAASGYDWEVIPTPDGSAAPLSENYNVIESAMSNPVVADLDGDGLREILSASYDGRLHAYWLDKTEHHDWPYAVHSTGPGIRFASEPVVADLDGDGYAEVLFASWPQKGGGQTGKLHILDYQGNVLHEIDLPAPYGGATWNGALAAPTLGNLDADADLELLLNTAHSGLVAYDLPGTSAAVLQWPTGRGNFQRSGSLLAGSLQASTMRMGPAFAAPGEPITVTITLQNPGPDLPDVSLENPLPSQTVFDGNLQASSGSAAFAADTVTWSGAVPAASPVTITYRLLLDAGLGGPTLITNQATVDDGREIRTLSASLLINGRFHYLPFLWRAPLP